MQRPLPTRAILRLRETTDQRCLGLPGGRPRPRTLIAASPLALAKIPRGIMHGKRENSLRRRATLVVRMKAGCEYGRFRLAADRQTQFILN